MPYVTKRRGGETYPQPKHPSSSDQAVPRIFTLQETDEVDSDSTFGSFLLIP